MFEVFYLLAIWHNFQIYIFLVFLFQESNEGYVEELGVNIFMFRNETT